MFKTKRGFLFFLLICVLFAATSCRSRRNNVLLKDVETSLSAADTSEGKVLKYEHKLRPDDKILISVWNHPELSNGTIYNSLSTQLIDESKALLIDKEGFANLPLIGRAKLSGMTISQAARTLEKLFESYYKDPIVTITVTNLRVSVLGEVNRPGMVPLKKEQTTLLEAISEAGDFSIDAKRSRVKIIRGDLSDPEIIVINLTTLNDLKKADLILHADDVIYVEPVRRKFTSQATQDILPYVSITSSIVSVFYLLFVVSNN